MTAEDSSRSPLKRGTLSIRPGEALSFTPETEDQAPELAVTPEDRYKIDRIAKL